MKRGYKKPIGYLLKLLNITQSELAAALYVDRSLVSKWVSGTQSFGMGSKYYQAVLQFLMQSADQGEQGWLQHFFQTYYQNQSVTIVTGLSRFLQETDVAEKKMEELFQEELNLQYVEASVSGDAKGRFLALISMLEQVLMKGDQKKQQLFLYDDEGFEWLSREQDWASVFMDRLEDVLRQGHKLSIITESEGSRFIKEVYMKRFFKFYRYKNFVEYFHSKEVLEHYSFSYYLWKDKEIIHAVPLANGIYTLALYDIGALQAAERNVQLHLQNSISNSMIQNNSELSEVLLYLMNVAVNDDTVYLYVTGLSVLTMSNELLQEILHENKVHWEKIQIISQFIEGFHKQLNSSPCEIRQFCRVQAIKEKLKQEQSSLPELLPFVGKPVYISNVQSKRHLEDTFLFLEEYPRMKTLFLREEELDLPEDSGFFCKENHYFIMIFNKMRVIKEPFVFKGMIHILDESWKRLKDGGRKYEEFND